jgi:hypothetical protein
LKRTVRTKSLGHCIQRIERRVVMKSVILMSEDSSTCSETPHGARKPTWDYPGLPPVRRSSETTPEEWKKFFAKYPIRVNNCPSTEEWKRKFEERLQQGG